MGGTHINADSMLLESVRVARPKNPCNGGETDRSLITYCAPRSATLLRCWTNADSHTKTAATITETASIEVASAKGCWPSNFDTPNLFAAHAIEPRASSDDIPELDVMDYIVHTYSYENGPSSPFLGHE